METAWVEAHLLGVWGSVGAVVPACFPRYVRVLHPATDQRGGSVTWAGVAKSTGRIRSRPSLGVNVDGRRLPRRLATIQGGTYTRDQKSSADRPYP